MAGVQETADQAPPTPVADPAPTVEPLADRAPPVQPSSRPSSQAAVRRWHRRAAVVAAFVVAGAAGAGGGAWLARQRQAAPGNAGGTQNLMGLSTVPVRPAPAFALTDQVGRRVSLSALRGKVVVLNFFDDRCIDLCPIIANELILARQHLGREARRVAFVAVNVNAAHASVGAVRSFTDDHGLAALPQWYFLTGPAAALERTWSAYGVTVQVDHASGAVFHSSPMYFIGPGGDERAVAVPQAQTLPDGRGYLPPSQIGQWGAGIAQEARALLRGA